MNSEYQRNIPKEKIEVLFQSNSIFQTHQYPQYAPFCCLHQNPPLFHVRVTCEIHFPIIERPSTIEFCKNQQTTNTPNLTETELIPVLIKKHHKNAKIENNSCLSLFEQFKLPTYKNNSTHSINFFEAARYEKIIQKNKIKTMQNRLKRKPNFDLKYYSKDSDSNLPEVDLNKNTQTNKKLQLLKCVIFECNDLKDDEKTIIWNLVKTQIQPLTKEQRLATVQKYRQKKNSRKTTKIIRYESRQKMANLRNREKGKFIKQKERNKRLNKEDFRKQGEKIKQKNMIRAENRRNDYVPQLS